MRNRWIERLFGGTPICLGRRVRGILAVVMPVVGLAVALVGAVPAERALAQQNSGGTINVGGGSGGTINIGGSIAATVADAVSGISTNASGGVQSTQSELSFGEQEGLAISDASGGNHNESLDSR